MAVQSSRDIKKAFDKVWHQGLKYKLWKTNPPSTLLKITCSFIDGRTAAVRLEGHIGTEFQLRSGVPQGSPLSPTLFNLYTADVPQPGEGCHQIIFADDHTQVITWPRKRAKPALAYRTKREIEKINNYERKWKIATCPEKFQMVPVSTRQPAEIRINNNIIEHQRKAKILGLTIGTTGLSEQVQNRRNIASNTLRKLRRFDGVSTDTYLRLYKTLVRPQLEYPAILMARVSRANIAKLQSIQNRALRRALRQRPPYFNTIEELHQQLGMEPLNTRLHRLATKTWQSLEIDEPQLVESSTAINSQQTPDHLWWKRLAPIINAEPPEPMYIG